MNVTNVPTKIIRTTGDVVFPFIFLEQVRRLHELSFCQPTTVRWFWIFGKKWPPFRWVSLLFRLELFHWLAHSDATVGRYWLLTAQQIETPICHHRVIVPLRPRPQSCQMDTERRIVCWPDKIPNDCQAKTLAICKRQPIAWEQTAQNSLRISVEFLVRPPDGCMAPEKICPRSTQRDTKTLGYLSDQLDTWPGVGQTIRPPQGWRNCFRADEKSAQSPWSLSYSL